MIVDRVHTTVTMAELAAELATSNKAPLPALLLAQVALENRRGQGLYNYNVGNITAAPGGPSDVFLAPWATPELIAQAPENLQPRYERLYQRMLKNQVPKYFRAYGSIGAGADGYVRMVTQWRFQPMVKAAVDEDPGAFARAVVATGYCPDEECGNGASYHAMAKQLASQGLAEYAGRGATTGGLGVVVLGAAALGMYWLSRD